MKFPGKTLFQLNPDVLYIESENFVRLTFATLEDKIFQIDQLAKDVFLMAIADFNLEQIIEVCQQTNLKQADVADEVQSLLLHLTQINILSIDHNPG